MTKHRKSVHEGIRPYACHQCNKRFCYSNDLKKHQYTHTGERPHACDLCNHRFSQLTNLKNHKKVIHQGIRSMVHLTSQNNETDKPFMCQLCGKSFKRSSNCEIHKKKVHQGIRTNICDLCEEPFNSIAELKLHLNVHTWPAIIG